MKMIYVFEGAYPNEKAHTIQTTQMILCLAETIDLVVLVSRDFDIKKFYNKYTSCDAKFIQIRGLSKGKKVNMLSYHIYLMLFSYYVNRAIKKHKLNDRKIFVRNHIVAYLLSIKNGKKLIFEIHKLEKSFMENYFLPKINYLVPLTKYSAKLISKMYHIDKGSIMALHDGYNEDLMSNIDPLMIDNNYLNIGYIGKFKTLNFDKGVKNLVKAYLELENKKCKLWLIGANENELKIYHKMKSEIDDKIIEVIGFVNYEKALRYIKSMDILVIPYPMKTHFDIYASPLKLFEYMASGKPIISTLLKTHKNIINDGEALFIENNSPKRIKEGLEMIMNNYNEIKNRSLGNIEIVKKYSWKNRVRRLIQFLEK